jgi:hypothetical protein
MLTAGDEYPIHQTPEPIAYSGSDRNFYDRFFFNGYSADGATFFAIALGVYPHLNIIDASVSVLRGGRQASLFLSRPLNMERMDVAVGPLRVEVLLPLAQVAVKLSETEGFAFDLHFTARSAPIEEPRFSRRLGPRTLMDLTRMTQNGRWSGKLRLDGEEIDVTPQQFTGTRDRSWGVRPIGAPDAQPMLPLVAPQFFWLWTPTHFPNLSLFFHVNEDGDGAAWNSRSVLMPDGAAQGDGLHLHHPKMQMTFAPGTRRMKTARLEVEDGQGRPHTVHFDSAGTFLMKGIGYGHARYRHGAFHGDQLMIAREDIVVADQPLQNPENLHIQEIVRARHEGPGGLVSDGIGAFEQLFLGPHAPSRLTDLVGPPVI